MFSPCVAFSAPAADEKHLQAVPENFMKKH